MEDAETTTTENSFKIPFPMPAKYDYDNISHHVPLEDLQMDSNMVIQESIHWEKNSELTTTFLFLS